MLFPSTFVTCLLTAFYLSIQHMPHIQGAMKGVLPATVGVGMVTACGMANQPLRESWARGWKQLLFAVVVITGSGLALWFEKASVTTILIGAALIGALEGVLSNRRGRQ
jgi:chromate transport protein ChrA